MDEEERRLGIGYHPAHDCSGQQACDAPCLRDVRRSLLTGKEPEKLIYKRIDGAELRLLVMKPEDWSAGDCRSAVLWIHGGGWTGGSPEQFVPHCRYMAFRGAVAFSVQYRLIGSGQVPPISSAAAAISLADCLADCEDAVRYIRASATELGIDPSRIVVAGDSAGGHLAACLGTAETETSLVNAVVNCNGIVDLTGKWRSVTDPPTDEEMADGEAAVRLWYERRSVALRLSPLFRVRAGQPPSLTMHGLLDRTVEPEQAVRFVEAHRACGNQAELVLLPRSKHAFILFNYTALPEETLAALDEIGHFLQNIGFLGGEDYVKNG